MIVVTANWLIGDGTLAPAVPACLAGVAPAIHRAVVRCGVRADGSYRPVERLDLVLAGDTFDWLASAEWLAGVKPWHGWAASEEVMTRVAQRSFHRGRAALLPLMDWARRGLEVPAARSGGPSVTVPVRITVLAGDRDARVEDMLDGRRESVAVGRRWDDGRVSIRHGHEYDPTCSPCGIDRGCRDDRPPTLAESVTVDLVARFAAAIGPAGRPLVRRLAAAGLLGIPAVIDAGCRETGAGATRIRETWGRHVDEWWRQARLSVPVVEAGFDAVDALAAWFRGAVGEHAPPPTPAAGLTSLAAGPARGSTGAVFGHLAGNGRPASAIGLGGEPRVVACPNSRGWPRWETIAGDDGSPAVVQIRPSGLDVADGDRIIDAA